MTTEKSVSATTPEHTRSKRQRSASGDSISPIIALSGSHKRLRGGQQPRECVRSRSALNLGEPCSGNDNTVLLGVEPVTLSQTTATQRLDLLINLASGYTMADFQFDLSQLNPQDIPLSPARRLLSCKDDWALHKICDYQHGKVDVDVFKSLVLGGGPRFDHIKRALSNMPGKDDDLQRDWDAQVDGFINQLYQMYVTRLETVGAAAKASVNNSISEFKAGLVQQEEKSMEKATRLSNEFGLSVIKGAAKSIESRTAGFEKQVDECARRDSRHGSNRDVQPMETDQPQEDGVFRSRAGSASSAVSHVGGGRVRSSRNRGRGRGVDRGRWPQHQQSYGGWPQRGWQGGWQQPPFARGRANVGRFRPTGSGYQRR
jgi:hypothetical protein